MYFAMRFQKNNHNVYTMHLSHLYSRWADIYNFEFRLTLMTIMFLCLILKINILPFIWDRVTLWEIVREKYFEAK